MPMTATTRCVRRSPPSCVSSTSIVSLGLAPVAMASMAAAARCGLPFANCRIDSLSMTFATASIVSAAARMMAVTAFHSSAVSGSQSPGSR